MNMKRNQKKSYVPPTVEVTHMALEKVIAASPVPKVNLKDWEYETPDTDINNNADVLLYF